MCDSHKGEGSMLPLMAWKLRNGQTRTALTPADNTESKVKPAAKPQPVSKANGRGKKANGATR